MANGYSYVALLDVLGYRDHVNSDRKHGTLSFKDKLTASLQVLHDINEDEVRRVAISDTVILSASSPTGLTDVLAACSKLFISFMQHDLMLRGGVAYSQHFSAGAVTYSHALTLAHELEHGSAIWPRVLVHGSALDASKENGIDLSGGDWIHQWNGQSILNVSKHVDWQTLFDCAKHMYKLQELGMDEQVFIKFVLFEKYLLSLPTKSVGKRGFIPKPNAY